LKPVFSIWSVEKFQLFYITCQRHNRFWFYYTTFQKNEANLYFKTIKTINHFKIECRAGIKAGVCIRGRFWDKIYIVAVFPAVRADFRSREKSQAVVYKPA